MTTDTLAAGLHADIRDFKIIFNLRLVGAINTCAHIFDDRVLFASHFYSRIDWFKANVCGYIGCKGGAHVVDVVGVGLLTG